MNSRPNISPNNKGLKESPLDSGNGDCAKDNSPTQIVLGNLERGSLAEQQAEDVLCEKGAEILFRNQRFPYGEVDLVAYRDEQVYLVEVKTVGKVTDLSSRISKRQKRALRYNRIWLQEEFKLPAKILYAFVRGSKIAWIRDEGD